MDFTETITQQSLTMAPSATSAVASAGSIDLDSTSAVGQKLASFINRLRSDAGGNAASLSSYQIAMQTVTLLQAVVKESK